MDLLAVSGMRKYVKTKQATANNAKQTYTMTSAVMLISVSNLKTSDTKALTNQFVVAERELAVPITCSGYISELMVHGVELIPNENESRKQETPMHATMPPAVYVESLRPSPVKDMPIAVTIQLMATKGVERRIM